jgi:hypothetical protein
MRRMWGCVPALALALTLAGAGGVHAQERGDMPDLDVDIKIDVITDFDRLGPGADMGAGERDDDGDIHVVLPGDRGGERDHEGSEAGEHEGTAGDHETETRDHEADTSDEHGDEAGAEAVGGAVGGGHERGDE